MARDRRLGLHVHLHKNILTRFRCSVSYLSLFMVKQNVNWCYVTFVLQMTADDSLQVHSSDWLSAWNLAFQLIRLLLLSLLMKPALGIWNIFWAFHRVVWILHYLFILTTLLEAREVLELFFSGDLRHRQMKDHTAKKGSNCMKHSLEDT